MNLVILVNLMILVNLVILVNKVFLVNLCQNMMSGILESEFRDNILNFCDPVNQSRLVHYEWCWISGPVDSVTVSDWNIGVGLCHRDSWVLCEVASTAHSTTSVHCSPCVTARWRRSDELAFYGRYHTLVGHIMAPLKPGPLEWRIGFLVAVNHPYKTL